MYFENERVKMCTKKRKSVKSRKEKDWDPRQDMKVRKWLPHLLSPIPMWSDDTLHTHKVTTTQLCLSAIFLNYFIHLNTFFFCLSLHKT